MITISRREALAFELRHVRDEISTRRANLKQRLHTTPQQQRLERGLNKRRAQARDIRRELKFA